MKTNPKIISKIYEDIVSEVPSLESMINHLVKSSEDLSDNLVFEARIKNINYDVWKENEKFKIIKSFLKDSSKKSVVKTMNKEEFLKFFIKEFTDSF